MHHARDPPVEDIDLAVITEHEVVGLEVAVHDASIVRELDGEADLRERREQATLRELLERLRLSVAAPRDHVRERRAADALHREVELSVGAGAEIVDGYDRGCSS